MRRLTPAALLAILILATPTAAHAHHNGYKYAAPTLGTLAVTGCDPHDWASVKLTWTPSKTSGGGFTSINYSRSPGGTFQQHLIWTPDEYGTRAQTNRATTTTIKNLRPGSRYYFRAYAGTFGGHRQSKFSNVRSIQLPTC